MSKTFRCNQSGNTVTFHTDFDIEQMYKHPDYTPVEDEPAPVKTSKRKQVQETPEVEE